MKKLLLTVGWAALGVLVADLIGTVASRARVERALDYEPEYRVKGPLVSVVIPALEEQDYVGLLLESIAHQTYWPIEVLVVDSSPPEEKRATEAIGAAYGAQMLAVPKLGVSIARNKGAEAAQGRILLFCDADCILAHDFTEHLVRELGRGSVLAHGVECIYDNLPIAMVWTPWQLFKPKDYTAGRGIAMRREDFWEVGGFDEACDPRDGYREDLDLGQRVLARFGPGSVGLVRNALIGTSARREAVYGFGKLWTSRGGAGVR